ncbi:MAG: DUF898 family protein [Pseudolabrys sp.]|nr:DUF898 family protein [Pseudolabrys sp.]
MNSASPPAAAAHVRFLGSRRAYWRLQLRGAFLLLVTLGIYRFWLATDIRRFLWSNTEVAGDTLEYYGTPLELLVGFLFAIAILIPIYSLFFLAALDLGVIGQFSGLIAFVSLFWLGQYAVFRARRYRLTRTIYRGIRFHQSGAPWRYAFRATAWWGLTFLTLGLAYPFQIASLERYKLRNTHYGDLSGRFEGTGWRLFLRGLPLWLAVIIPIGLALGSLIATINFTVLGDALAENADDILSRLAPASPGLAIAVFFALAMVLVAFLFGLVLYPLFQALLVRWWSSGLRFGALAVVSRLRTGQVYGAYARFIAWALLFCIALGLLIAPTMFAVDYITTRIGASPVMRELLGTAALLGGYVFAALGFSTIYRSTVIFSLWQLGMNALELSDTSQLETVKAAGTPSSAIGEGLADALHVGGL